jgi:dipeptidyl aminopeptidase/acylaminoacyl peptidase
MGTIRWPYRHEVLALVACLAAWQAPAARGQDGIDKKPAWTPEACFKIKNVGDVQPSPDCGRVVYTVTETIFDDRSAGERTQAYVANADGSGARPLAKGTQRSTSPQWSPDGAFIGYLAGGTLYRVRPDGGGGESLTAGVAVTSFRWSPDGAAVAFMETAPAPKKSLNAGLVVGEDIFDWRPPLNRLCVVSTVPDGKGLFPVRRLTGSDFQAVNFDWSPDGKHLAVTGVGRDRPAASAIVDLILINVATGARRALLTCGGALRDLHYSPDGQWIACTVSDVPPTWTGARRVHLFPVKGGMSKVLAATGDGAPALVGWSADSAKLYYVEAERTAVRLFALPLEGAPIALSNDDNVIGGKADGWVRVFLNAPRTMAGFTMETLQTPPEAFVSKLDAFEPVRVTKVNDDLRKLPIPATKVIRWKNRDGTAVEGLLTFPAAYVAGQRYPLLVMIHGGPNSVYSQSFLAHPSVEPVATFAERGYVVLRPNPRGSTGYGVKFRQANHRDWGGGDYQDVMAGVDHVIALGVADDKRLGVLGYSYGGFLAAWTITQTKRFRAASVGAGITNLVSFAGTTAVSSLLPSYYGTDFWDRREALQKQSPVFHVKDVQAPTLIYHGDQDIIAPIGQAHELYSALKRQGGVTQMVVYPGATHNPGSFRKLDMMRRNLAWMDKYVK